MKTIATVILSMVLLLALCSCGTKAPASVTKDFLGAVKSYDQKTIADLSIDGDFMKSVAETDENQKSYKPVFEKLKYTIGETTINGDSSTVKVNIETVDMKTILQQYLASAMSSAFLEEATTVSDEQMENEFIEAIKKSDKTVKNDVEVHMKKVDSNWKVIASEGNNEEFYNALTGGMLDYAKEFAGSLANQ